MLVVYCARQVVLTLKLSVIGAPSTGYKYHFTYINNFDAHHGRLSSLSIVDICEGQTRCYYMATSGTDGLAKFWTWSGTTWHFIRQLNTHELYQDVVPTTTCVTYLPKSKAHLILCATDKGQLVIWKLDGGTYTQQILCKKFENESAVHCSWETNLNVSDTIRAAVGYKKGIVGVYKYTSVTVGKATITQLFSIYAHDKDVCHVTWTPKSTKDDNSLDPDLASCGRDHHVKLWCVKTSLCCVSARVPGHIRSKPSETRAVYRDRDNNSNGAPWVSIVWALPNESSSNRSPVLYVTNASGEIFRWKVDDNEFISLNASDKYLNSSTLGHSQLIFTLLLVRGFEFRHDILVSFGQDRKIIVWSEAPELEIKSSMVTLPSFVTSLAQSIHGMGPVAVGLGDGSIYLWKPGRGLPADEQLDSFMDSDQSKPPMNSPTIIWPLGRRAAGITALAWHPDIQHCNLLAYGTESGAVGIIDVSKPQNKLAKVQPMGSTVYRVAWGPLLASIEVPKVTGVSKRNRNDNKKPDEQCDAFNLADVETKGDFVPDINHVARPLKSDHLYIYSICRGKLFFHLENKAQIELGSKLPRPACDSDSDPCKTDIAFQLISPLSSSKTNRIITSQFSCLAAVGGRLGSVEVFALRRSSESIQSKQHNCQLICRLSNHTKVINSLAWSPSINCLFWLAIGSNEHFVTVSDFTSILVRKAEELMSDDARLDLPVTELTTYLVRLEGHSNRITVVDWSPFENGCLLTASFDRTATVWRLTPSTSAKCTPSAFVSASVHENGHAMTSCTTPVTPCSVSSNYVVEALSNFREHRLRLYACLWSRREPDLVFTGDEGASLFAWRPSLQTVHQRPPSGRRNRPPQPKVDTSVSALSDRTLDTPSELVIDKVAECGLPTVEEVSSQPSMKTIVMSRKVLVTETKTKNATDNVASRSKNSKVSKKSGNSILKRPALFALLFPAQNAKLSSEINLTKVPPMLLEPQIYQVIELSHIWHGSINGPHKADSLSHTNYSLEDQPLITTVGLVNSLSPVVKLFCLPVDYFAASNRPDLIKLVEAEAQRHLAIATPLEHAPTETDQPAQGDTTASLSDDFSPLMLAGNRHIHLETYCFIMLWLGRPGVVAALAHNRHFLPYWLLWALSMMMAPPIPGAVLPIAVGSGVDAATASVDLLLEKLKEMSAKDPDPQLASTLLICAHRPLDAVNYLIQFGRYKEALVLIRLRLSSTTGQPLIRQCLQRLSERSSSVNDGLPHAVLCRIACCDWSGVMRFLRQAVLDLEHRQSVVTNATQPSPVTADLLATGWAELAVLNAAAQFDSLCYLAPKHAITCLRAAFTLPDPSQQVIFLSAAALNGSDVQGLEDAFTAANCLPPGDKLKDHCPSATVNFGTSSTAIDQTAIEPLLQLALDGRLSTAPSPVRLSLRSALLDSISCNADITDASMENNTIAAISDVESCSTTATTTTCTTADILHTAATATTPATTNDSAMIVARVQDASVENNTIAAISVIGSRSTTATTTTCTTADIPHTAATATTPATTNDNAIIVTRVQDVSVVNNTIAAISDVGSCYTTAAAACTTTITTTTITRTTTTNNSVMTAARFHDAGAVSVGTCEAKCQLTNQLAVWLTQLAVCMSAWCALSGCAQPPTVDRLAAHLACLEESLYACACLSSPAVTGRLCRVVNQCCASSSNLDVRTQILQLTGRVAKRSTTI